MDWYRCPLDRGTLQALNCRSNALALLQAGGYLSVLVATASLAWYSAYHWPAACTAAALFLHGTCYAFQINAVHELGHKTVFTSRSLNSAFEHLFAFLGWVNHRMFWTSHLQHHRFTLHPPDDLEVVLPIKLTVADFVRTALVNPGGIRWTVEQTWRIAAGHFEGPWELQLYPPDDTENRRAAVRWARVLLAGHLLILALSLYFRLWMLPLLTTLAPFYGGWLHFLCNNTQHAGLQDNVEDFRLCCRTIHLNPVIRFLYWQMNCHTEHHMYPGVPCYRLGRLHRAVFADLPPTLGLVGAWREIAGILRRQKSDVNYRFPVPLPAGAASSSSAPAETPA